MRRITMAATAAAIVLGGLLGGAGTATAEPDRIYGWCSLFGGEIVTTEIPLSGALSDMCVLPYSAWF